MNGRSCPSRTRCLARLALFRRGGRFARPHPGRLMTTGGSGPLLGLGAISSVTVQTMPISLSVGLGTITAVTVRTIPISLSDGEIRNGCLKNH